MPTYIFSYRPAKDFDSLADPTTLPAWGTFLNEVIAPHVVDPGRPVFEPPELIGEVGSATRLGGYSIVTADDLEARGVHGEELPHHRARRRRRGRPPG
jgi:hypothetical protein